ncbi:unnamed protein product [Spirodela intermedia]|uniref:Uncharacterized protein n=1 Tax=Spirodela intermedia TaxID=51605 RepID=A0A7I8IFF3_SPIIN|nr:unnamed protein product [Spirodela intermedia]CAA6656429.1 unnamed protein product [Spirodela intermedia]
MSHCGDATKGERDLATSGATKGLGDARYPSAFSMLSKANYPLWAIQMQLHLEAHSPREAIESETIARKKDRQALSMMLRVVSSGITKKSTKRSSRLISREKKNKSYFHMVLRKQEGRLLR